MRSYCHGAFSEEVVKGNFVLVYELLDELLDYGYPQLTDPAVLKQLIFQKVCCRDHGVGGWWGGVGWAAAQVRVATAQHWVRVRGRIKVATPA